MKKKLAGILIISLLLFMPGFCNVDELAFIGAEGKVICNEAEDGYEIVLYDKWGSIVDTTWSPVEPGIHDVTNELVEIVISVGSPAHYVFYFDKKSNKVSDVFFNPILIDDKYIAYMGEEPEKELIIMDLFNEGEVYKEINRDFSPVIDFNSAVSIEVLDENNFLLEYLSGEDYEVVKEVVAIK